LEEISTDLRILKNKRTMKPAAQVEMNSIVISTSLIPMLEKEAGKKELK